MDLLPQYKDSLRQIQRLKHQLSEERTTRTYRIVRDKTTYKEKKEVTSEEKQPITNPETLLTGIVDSLTYAIEWMEHNREPGLRRGADRRSGEQREVAADPLSLLFDQMAFNQWTAPEAGGKVSHEDRERLEEMLAVLSHQEREAFLLVKGRGFSQYDAAEILGVSREAVKSYLERAEAKFRLANRTGVQTILFDLIG